MPKWFSAENDKWKVNVSSPETAKVSSFWQGVLDSKTALVANRWDDSFGKALVDQRSSAPSEPPGRARSWPTP